MPHDSCTAVEFVGTSRLCAWVWQLVDDCLYRALHLKHGGAGAGVERAACAPELREPACGWLLVLWHACDVFLWPFKLRCAADYGCDDLTVVETCPGTGASEHL